MTDQSTDVTDELRAIPPGMRAAMIATYRDIAEGSRVFGHDDIVEHCEQQIARLKYGGSLVLWGVSP